MFAVTKNDVDGDGSIRTHARVLSKICVVTALADMVTARRTANKTGVELDLMSPLFQFFERQHKRQWLRGLNHQSHSGTCPEGCSRSRGHTKGQGQLPQSPLRWRCGYAFSKWQQLLRRPSVWSLAL